MNEYKGILERLSDFVSSDIPLNINYLNINFYQFRIYNVQENIMGSVAKKLSDRHYEINRNL
jgi:hypothetical protein